MSKLSKENALGYGVRQIVDHARPRPVALDAIETLVVILFRIFRGDRLGGVQAAAGGGRQAHRGSCGGGELGPAPPEEGAAPTAAAEDTPTVTAAIFLQARGAALGTEEEAIRQ
jgi:hypothetical protein